MSGARPFLPALVMLLASVGLLVGLSVRTPEAGAQIALVFPPGTPAELAIGSLARMDARFVRSGGFDNVLIAQFERAVGWAELRGVGVLLPLDPILAGGCALAS